MFRLLLFTLSRVFKGFFMGPSKGEVSQANIGVHKLIKEIEPCATSFLFG